MHPEALFRENLPLIDRVIERVCRRARLFGADAEDFASTARLALIENDYAVLRKYEGRASLATFLAVVLENLLADERVRQYGKWHASAEAERLGPPGLLLERLLHRERRVVADAVTIVRMLHPHLSARDVETMAARLPDRPRRPMPVDVDSLDELPVAAEETADARVVEADARRLSDRAAGVVRRTLGGMDIEDRTLLRFRFAREMAISDIARVMRLPQRPLYRRFEALLGRLRAALMEAGIDAADAAMLIAAGSRPLDFGLENGKSEDDRPSLRQDAPS